MSNEQNERPEVEEVIILPEPETAAPTSPEAMPNEGLADPADTASEEKPEPPVGKAIKAMVFGIISIEAGCIPLLSILGIVFAALARKWSRPIIENFPYTGARLFAKAGRITGTVGLILSIVFTAFWALYFDILIALLIVGAFS